MRWPAFQTEHSSGRAEPPARPRTCLNADVAAGRDARPYRTVKGLFLEPTVRRLPCIRLLWTIAILSAWNACTEASLTNRFPVKISEGREQVFAELVQAPEELLAELVAGLAGTQTAERVAAEYALDGWTTYTLRPGADETERPELALALASAVAGTTTAVSDLDEGARRDHRIRNIGLVFQEFELLEYLSVEGQYAASISNQWSTSSRCPSARHRRGVAGAFRWASSEQTRSPTSTRLSHGRATAGRRLPGAGHRVRNSSWRTSRPATSIRPTRAGFSISCSTMPGALTRPC